MITLNVVNSKGEKVGSVDVDEADFGGTVNKQLLHEVVLMHLANQRRGTHSTLLWALTRMREGADPFALVSEAARHGIDIAALPAIAARLR